LYALQIKMKPQVKHRLGSRRGNAMIEFALASFVLIPLFVGTFQFGYTFYVYNLLCTQMRAGARYASLKTFTGSGVSAYKTAVQNMVMYGNPDGTGTLIEPGLTVAQIDVEVKGTNGADASATNIPSYVTVTTNNYSVNAVITTFTFNGKPIVRFPYLGRYAPSE
jgi:Flp pilus assembly protein TadG